MVPETLVDAYEGSDLRLLVMTEACRVNANMSRFLQLDTLEVPDLSKSLR